MPSADASASIRVLPAWSTHAYRPIALNGVLLSDLAKLPDVSVGNPVPEEELIKIQFRFTGPGGPFGTDVGTVTAWLDPQNDYRIVRAVAEPKAGSSLPMRYAWECVYDPITGVIASTKDRSSRQRPDMTPPASVEGYTERDYDWSYRGPADRSELYLSFYGLPEPAFKKAGSYRTQPWLYYFGGGVLCVAVGAFFAHRAVRRKA
jgi:hypothetical protein